MWTTTFCPNFRFRSFSFINVCIQIIVFFIAVVQSGTDEFGFNDKIFLGVNPPTLEQYGMRMPYRIVVDYEVWRLFTSIYITHGLITLTVSSLAQLILGFRLEG